jgi:hypothetical protein
MGSRRDWNELDRLIDKAVESGKAAQEPRRKVVEIPVEFMKMPLSELGKKLEKMRLWGFKKDGTLKLRAYGDPERLNRLLAMDRAFKQRLKSELE